MTKRRTIAAAATLFLLGGGVLVLRTARPAADDSLIATSAVRIPIGSPIPPPRPVPSAPRADALADWVASVETAAIPEILEQLQTIADDDLRADARAGLLHAWADRDLKAALAWFCVRGGADRLHEQARDILASHMIRGSAIKMARWMESSLPAAGRRELSGPFFRIWATAEPRQAGDEILRMLASPADGDGTHNLDLLGQTVTLWAGADLNGTLVWITALPEGAAKTRALEQVCYRWTEIDPVAAAASVQSRGNQRLAATVAGKWAESDPRAASVWAATLTDQSVRIAALEAALSCWARRDPAGALTLLTETPLPAHIRTELSEQIANAAL
jgi:hypothetical protein